MNRARASLIWASLATAICVPVALAAASPFLAFRDPIYIGAGFAGIVALGIILLQPLLAGGYLPGLPAIHGRRIHRITGILLVIAIIAHVVGLWITSPPDVIDALLFASPTPFSVWGVIAMWAVFATGILAMLRRRLRLPVRRWRRVHGSFALIIVSGTVAHAMLIEGAMETMSKAILCALVIAATVIAFVDLRVFARHPKSR